MDLRKQKTLPFLLVSMFLLATAIGMPVVASTQSQNDMAVESTTATVVATAAPIETLSTPYCGPIDLTIALDNTGSMGSAIANIKAELPTIIATALAASDNDLRVGYMTFKDNIVVHNQLTKNLTAVNASILATGYGGGAGWPEASDEAKNTAVNNLAGGTRNDSAGNSGTQTGNYTEAYRDDALKLVILITDAPPGGFNDNNETADETALAVTHADSAFAKGIKVSDVFVPTGDLYHPAGGDYAGQAALLKSDANRTGGVYIKTAANGSGTGEAIRAIIEACGSRTGSISGVKFHDMNGNGEKDDGEMGLEGWKIILTMPDGTVLTTTTSDNGTYSFEELLPGMYLIKEIMQDGWYMTAPEDPLVEVVGGEETIVDFGNKLMPVAACVETVNPAGKNVPKAGKTRPNPQGQNQDGFYELIGEDETGLLKVSVIDMGTGTVFGPYPSGTKIKYTENGAAPSVKPMAAANDAVDYKITGQGDAVVLAIDVNGKVSVAFCMVPPPPK